MFNRLKDVFESFQKHTVKYLAIGGIAAFSYGISIAIFDSDMLIEATRKNAHRLLDALSDAGMDTASLTNVDEVLSNEITVFKDQARIDVQIKTSGIKFNRYRTSLEGIHMSSKKTRTESDRRNHIIAEVRHDRERQEKTYRGRALKMFPRICARCGREFSGKRVRELTVHHKDHNHDNNPPDGSNWELLCIYCHDNEHSRDQVAEWYDKTTPDSEQDQHFGNKPFENLKDLLKDKKS